MTAILKCIENRKSNPTPPPPPPNGLWSNLWLKKTKFKVKREARKITTQTQLMIGSIHLKGHRKT